jgi:hypothetical protein
MEPIPTMLDCPARINTLTTMPPLLSGGRSGICICGDGAIGKEDDDKQQQQ